MKFIRKMAPTALSPRHFLVVPLTEEISKYLVEDLVRILEINNPVM